MLLGRGLPRPTPKPGIDTAPEKRELNAKTIHQSEESEALLRLRQTVEGEVLTPVDNDYEGAKMAWNLTIVNQPAVVVVADSIADVQAAVAYANEENLPVAVQNTGHGMPRHCDGGVLIRLGRLNYVVVDSDRQSAHIGGGAKWNDVLPVAGKAGLAGLAGSSPGVGVVGYTLGGGFSLLSRKYGLAIDSVRSMKVVLADGSLVTVSPTENEDLFWAIRGGGGGFGVVVEMEMALYANAEVFGGAVLYPAARAAEIYPKYIEWTKTLPNEVSTSISLMFFPPVPFIPEPLRLQSFVIITGCVSDPVKGEELMAPMRELGDAVMNEFGVFPYSESAAIYRDPVDPLPANGHGVLLKDLTPEGAVALVQAMGAMHESPHLRVELRHLGGAISDGSAPAAAIGNRREAQYLVYMLGIPMPPNSPEAMETQADRVFDILGDHVLCPGPLNFIGEGNIPANRMRAVFADEDHARLVEIKRARDPQNRFAFAGLGITTQA